jgi:hypothetical protein
MKASLGPGASIVEHCAMRTTLTLDHDLAALLKQRARKLGVPIQEVLNRAIRTGLDQNVRALPRSAAKTRPHWFGFRSGIDPDKPGQLADDLETEAFGALTAIGPTKPNLKSVLQSHRFGERGDAFEEALGASDPGLTADPRTGRKL